MESYCCECKEIWKLSLFLVAVSITLLGFGTSLLHSKQVEKRSGKIVDGWLESKDAHGRKEKRVMKRGCKAIDTSIDVPKADEMSSTSIWIMRDTPNLRRVLQLGA